MAVISPLADGHGRDAENVQYVYAWRLEQEAGLRKAKGSGMTDDQVVEFVNDCMISTISSTAGVKAANDEDRLSGIRTLYGPL